jgi:hypothetical protein
VFHVEAIPKATKQSRILPATHEDGDFPGTQAPPLGGAWVPGNIHSRVPSLIIPKDSLVGRAVPDMFFMLRLVAAGVPAGRKLGEIPATASHSQS